MFEIEELELNIIMVDVVDEYCGDIRGIEFIEYVDMYMFFIKKDFVLYLKKLIEVLLKGFF